MKVLKVLAKEYGNGWDGLCLYMSTIARRAGMPKAHVRHSVRALARKGLAEFHRGLMDDEGKVAGSGYCATKKGALMISACKDCKNKVPDMVDGTCISCWEAAHPRTPQT